MDTITLSDRKYEVFRTVKSIIFDDAYYVFYKDSVTGVTGTRLINGQLGEEAAVPKEEFINALLNNYDERTECVTETIEFDDDVFDGINSFCRGNGISMYALTQAISKFLCDPANKATVHRTINKFYEFARASREKDLLRGADSSLNQGLPEADSFH